MTMLDIKEMHDKAYKEGFEDGRQGQYLSGYEDGFEQGKTVGMEFVHVGAVVNNNQPGWLNVIETGPNCTLPIGTKVYIEAPK